MKKLAMILTSLALALGLTACSGQQSGESSVNSTNSVNSESTTQQSSDDNESPKESSSNDSSESQNESSSSESSDTPEVTEPVDGKILVVYYSASGNTKTIAEYIAAETGGELFELEPVNPYSNADLDWTNRDSRVSKEHSDTSLRTVELVNSTVSDWETYETVFIGYPIWWGIAAWPVDGFISANDFSGKTVIPFCTSTSSGLGDSGKLLADAAGEGNWLEGIRFRSRESEDTVKSWVQGLGL